jgi:hypothetical protein
MKDEQQQERERADERLALEIERIADLVIVPELDQTRVKGGQPGPAPKTGTN